MRIVHFSDFHLKYENDNYRLTKFLNALNNDLLEFNAEKEIDLIFITGDLVDKGGISLINEIFPCPFKYFERKVIDNISNGTNIDKSKFLFIPGNHDVNNNKIDLCIESKIKNRIRINTDCYNSDIEEVINNYSKYMDNRLVDFKNFEKSYYDNYYSKSDKITYSFNNHSSSLIYKYKEYKIGICLVNDSWRICNRETFLDKIKNCVLKKINRLVNISKDESKLPIGIIQLYKSLELFKRYETNLNLLLHHHPIENYFEELEIKEDFISHTTGQDIFDMCFYGHYHEHELITPSLAQQSIFFRSRASYNKPDELNQKYKPGYSIIDVDFNNNKLGNVIYRIYDRDISENRYKFQRDINYTYLNNDGKLKEKHLVELNIRNLKTLKSNPVLDKNIFINKKNDDIFN